MYQVNPRTKKTTFSIKTSGAKNIFLLGDFNGWNETATPLKKGKANVWTTEIKLNEGEYQFLYRVDGQWQTDDSAQRVINAFGTENSLAQIIFPKAKKPALKKKKK